jgi:hypothetical protein
MSVNSGTINLMYLIAVLIGTIGVIIVIARLNDTDIPFISSDKAAFFALGIVGFIMCILVMKHGIELYGWTDLFVIISSVLGTVILLLVAVVIFQIENPIISNDRTALFLLTGLLLAKVILANGQRLLDLVGILY